MYTDCIDSFFPLQGGPIFEDFEEEEEDMGSRAEDNKNVTDWTIFVDPDTGEHYYSSKSKKSLVHNIPVGIKAR